MRVTDADAKALDSLREAEQKAFRAAVENSAEHELRLAAVTDSTKYDELLAAIADNSRATKVHHFAEVLPGDLAAVTRNGDVYKINPDKFSDAKKYLDLVDDRPGVIETRARFEIENEKTAALWTQHRADIAEARQDFAAARESAWQYGQLASDMRQSNRELGEAVDTGFKAAGGLSSSFARAIETVLSGIFSFFDSGPKLTPEQAEREARVNEELAEARARDAAAQEKDAAQDSLLAELQRQAREREEEERFRRIMRDAAREDRGYERERERER